MPPTRRARRTRLRPIVIAARLGIYILVTWGTLEFLASGLFPGAQVVTLLLALFTTIPIAASSRGSSRSSWPRSISKAAAGSS